ncbi:DNRLRE domain-containing protein [Streptomyces sp. NPDC088348]|uniref:DNRLRE domain-containing protein n=1 Tax=Streptomyces sp. NPDC088348 TaxID=3365853 RepID=UPI0038096576
MLLLATDIALTTGQAAATEPTTAVGRGAPAEQPSAAEIREADLAWATKHSRGGIPWALAEAKKSGQKVLAPNETTPTNLTYANPDGTLTSEVTAGPERMERDGKWVDVDATLTTTADGGVQAKAHPEGLTLAPGGGAPPTSLKAAQDDAGRDLVTLGTGDEQVKLQWKGGLPKPVLDGTTATYKHAVPGADVIVKATRTGFEQFVNLDAKPAAGDYTYTLPLKTKGLRAKAQKDGSVLFTDATTGAEKVTMPAPMMWDASVDKVSGKHENRAPVGMKVIDHGAGNIDLEVTPDAGFLADPGTAYPVTVDPSTSALGNTFDTYVQQGETTDLGGETELDFGNPGTTNADGTPRTARTLMTWNTAGFADALVSSASVQLYNFHSGATDCKAQGWTVWNTGAGSGASRWTKQPAWLQQYGSSTQTAGYPTGCTSTAGGWIKADVTDLAKIWASQKATSGYMGVRAASDDAKGWKRVNSRNATANQPKLTVNYNFRPGDGTAQQAGAPFKSYAGVWAVNSTTPTLRDQFADADGDKVNGTFQVYDAVTNKPITTPAGDGAIVSADVAPGSWASVKVPAGQLVNGKTYKFRTNSYDGTHYNLNWSPWREFVVDTTAPGEPTSIASVLYPEDMPGGGKGIQDRFDVVTGVADAREVQYRLDVPDTEAFRVAATPWQGVPTTNGGLNASFNDAPDEDGVHVMQVRSVDRADNTGTTREYGFMSPAIDTNRANKIDIELPDPDTNIDTTKPFINDPLPANWAGHGYPDAAVRNGKSYAADPLKAKSDSYTAKGKDGHTYTATTTFTPRKADKLPTTAALKAPRAKSVRVGDPTLPILDGWCKPENKFDPTWPSLFTRNDACMFGTLTFSVSRMDAPGIEYTQNFETVYAVHTARDSQEVKTWFQVTPWSRPSPGLPFTSKPGVLDMDIRSLCTSDGCDDADKIKPYTCTGDPDWSGPGTLDNHTTTCEATHQWNGKTVNDVNGTGFTEDVSHSMQLGFGWGGKFNTSMFEEDDLEKISDAISPELVIACDDVYKPKGCVMSAYPPGYVVNAAKYPAAAAHIWLISQRHAKKLGASPSTPLHYLPAIDRNRVGRETEDKMDPMGRLPGNRKAVCGRAWRKHRETSKHDELVKPKPDGTRTPDSISCDEFPFAKSWESPGFPAGTPYGGLNPAQNTERAGLECLQTATIKRDGKDHFLNDTRYDDPKKETICGRSSMSGYTNSGSMSAFGLRFAPEFRLLDRDAYWVDVDAQRFKDCDATKDVVKCKMG